MLLSGFAFRVHRRSAFVEEVSFAYFSFELSDGRGETSGIDDHTCAITWQIYSCGTTTTFGSGGHYLPLPGL